MRQGEHQARPGGARGCPRPTAPPFTLTRSISRPRSLTHATAWPANASLISHRSMSSTESPARSSAFLLEGTGPYDMMAGSKPTMPHDTIRASASSPSDEARDADFRTKAAAPSTIPEALAAVTRLSGPNAVGKPARMASFESRTTWSSSADVMMRSPRREGITTSTISSAHRPEAMLSAVRA